MSAANADDSGLSASNPLIRGDGHPVDGQSCRSGDARCGKCRYHRIVALNWFVCEAWERDMFGVVYECDKWTPETQVTEGR